MLTWSIHAVRNGWIPVMNLIILNLRSTPWYKASECAPYKYACAECLTVLPGRQLSNQSCLHAISKRSQEVSVYDSFCAVLLTLVILRWAPSGKVFSACSFRDDIWCLWMTHTGLTKWLTSRQTLPDMSPCWKFLSYKYFSFLLNVLVKCVFQ